MSIYIILIIHSFIKLKFEKNIENPLHLSFTGHTNGYLFSAVRI